MESSVEALKMAFAVFVFVMALSLSIATFSQARETSEIVLRASDTTTYYDYLDYTVGGLSENRIVGMETIIPTLYKYDKERYKVTFRNGKNYYNPEDGSFTVNVSDLPKLEIYTTDTNRSLWNKSYTNDFDGKSTSTSAQNEKRICSFDIVEETQRNEPWTGSSAEIKKHLDTMISGGIYSKPQYLTGNTINYNNNGLVKYKNEKFVEQIGRNTITEETTDSITGIKGNKTTTKITITYILIN